MEHKTKYGIKYFYNCKFIYWYPPIIDMLNGINIFNMSDVDSGFLTDDINLAFKYAEYLNNRWPEPIYSFDVEEKK